MQDAALAPQAAYEALVAGGEIQTDEAQRHVAARLQHLHDVLAAARKRRKGKAAAPARGLYIWGDVGRGKSLLMDMFFASAPVERKRRVHFHAFMQEVHASIHRTRQDKSGDPVALLATSLAQNLDVLCFDELQATDIADATLLFRLFSGLFDAGIVIVATSNRPPKDIYQGKVQPERFARFIALLESRMEVLALQGATDYRTVQERAARRTYFYPLGEEADRFVAETVAELAAGALPETVNLPVHGRVLTLKAYGGAAVASFHGLCGLALGPADYLAIAERFSTLVVTGIPELSPEKRNEAQRFTTLIDALYERRARLICTAAEPPERLYPEGDGSFEFRRTVSRLVEMQSEGYGG
ncbi:MAG: AFG1 family ATPase [Alphaproteobacteria bacterium]|nr:AFG1 family ATPase [Alphaproteobacteria bacterium]